MKSDLLPWIIFAIIGLIITIILFVAAVNSDKPELTIELKNSTEEYEITNLCKQDIIYLQCEEGITKFSKEVIT